MAYFNQNHEGGAFSHWQIELVVQHFLDEGKKPLLVLHEKWFDDTVNLQQHWDPFINKTRKRADREAHVWTPQLTARGMATKAGSGSDTPSAEAGAAGVPFQEELCAKWLGVPSLVYQVEKGSNDDWYWMYAASASGGPGGAYVISNDKMRDHFFQMLNPGTFPTWRDRKQVRGC